MLRTMKRVLPLVAIVAAALAAATAHAAVSAGTFTGKTTAKDPIGITVNGSSRVTGMYFEGVHMTCTDKDEYDTLKGADRTATHGRKVRIKKSGKWTLNVSTNKGAMTWTASGRFTAKGTRTTGTLSINARYNDENELDPQGPIRCQSGKLKFTATR